MPIMPVPTMHPPAFVSPVLHGRKGTGDAPPPPSPLAEPASEYETWDNEKLYQWGTNLLKNGRSFNRAIQVFEIAARREPNNVNYQLALGCAYACRFASICQAARRTKSFAYYQQTYPNLRAEWEKAQKDAQNPNYNKPAPAPPSPPVTPDDKRPFVWTDEQTKQELLRLGARSVTAFDHAQKLTPQLPAQKQSEANYVRGWGLFLLRREGSGQKIVQDTPPTPKKETAAKPADVLVIGSAQVTDCFRFCCDKEPENTAYWQSLAWAIVPDYLDGKAGEWGSETLYWESGPHYQKETLTDAIHALEQALAHKPHDFNILYSLALLSAPSAPSASAAYLEKAAGRQRGNAALWYLLAEVQFRQSENIKNDPEAVKALQKKAIGTIERGNVGGGYQASKLFLPVPSLLRTAWEYQEPQGFGNDERVLISLYSRVGAYLEEADTDKDCTEFLRGASAMMGMALKAVQSVTTDPAFGQANLHDLWQAGAGRAVRILGGIVNCYAGYGAVHNSQAARPDAQKAQFLEKNEGAFNYIKGIDKQLNQ